MFSVHDLMGHHVSAQRQFANTNGVEAPVVISGVQTPLSGAVQTPLSSAVQMPLTCEELARRVALRDAVLLASKLLAKIEQMNFMYAIDALQQISAAERLSVVKVMVAINKQHRSVIRSLPTLSLKVRTVGGSSSLCQLTIAYQNEDQEQTWHYFVHPLHALVFTFDADELDGTVKISRCA